MCAGAIITEFWQLVLFISLIFSFVATAVWYGGKHP